MGPETATGGMMRDKIVFRPWRNRTGLRKTAGRR